MTGFKVNMSPLVNSSINMGNAYRGIGQQLGGAIQNAGEMYAQKQQQEQDLLLQQQSQQQQQGAQAALNDLSSRAMQGDPEAFQQLMTQSPQDAQKVAQYLQQQGQNAQDDRFTSKMAQETAGFVEQLHLAPVEQQEAMFNAAVGDDRYDIDEEDRTHFMDPNARKALVSQVKGEDYSNTFFGGDGGNGPLPAEAIAFNDLIKDMTPAQKKTAKQIKAGLKGRAVTNAELTAIESGDIKNYSDYKVKQKQAEKFAELTGSSRARAIDAGVEKIQKIDIGVKNIDKAISLLESDAGVGAIEKWLPSIKASTVALNNLQSTMALDVIGAVTFGALSQGELDLAKNVALNTKLDTPDLIADLQARKSAQEKLRAYFNEQIQHLDQGGTKASFMRKKEREMEGDTSGDVVGNTNQDNQALQWAQANPNDPRAAQIMQKLQGNQ